MSEAVRRCMVSFVWSCAGRAPKPLEAPWYSLAWANCIQETLADHWHFQPNRGNQNGGVGTRDDCLNLPTNLQGGCYWRFNWARGNINGWSVTYNQVQCPSRLTSISGCSA